jgi:hypothetical protein
MASKTKLSSLEISKIKMNLEKFESYMVSSDGIGDYVEILLEIILEISSIVKSQRILWLFTIDEISSTISNISPLALLNFVDVYKAYPRKA